MRRWIASGVLGLVAVLVLPAAASADARVSVRLTDHEGRPVDGSVTLASSAVTRSCRTTASRCTITVPSGTYTVTLRPVRGSAPPARTLRVPDSGTVSLALTAGPPRIQTTSIRRAGSIQTTRPSTRRTTTTTATRTRPSVARRTTTVRGGTRPRSTTTRRTTSGTSVRRATTTAAVRRTTTSPSTGTGSSGSTEGGSSSSTEEPDAPAVRAVAAGSVTATAEGRDLSSGDDLSVQGRVLDGAGRPVDATITVSRGGTIVGRVSTTASRFSMYDLDAGTYDVIIRPSRGDTRRSRITVGSETARVTLRVR